MRSFLIKECLCGNFTCKQFEKDIVHNIPVLICKICDTMHQILDMDEEGLKQYYEQEYDKKHKAKDRYSHDKEIAKLRMDSYRSLYFFPKTGKSLDIGCNNGAFVDEAALTNYDSWGVELNPECRRERVLITTLQEAKFEENSFSFITLHDVLEHVTQPKEFLKEVIRVLHPEGVLVVDFPHFFVPEGVHHFKPVEHIWFLKENQVKKLLEDSGLSVLHTNIPIKSKLVFFAKKM